MNGGKHITNENDIHERFILKFQLYQENHSVSVDGLVGLSFGFSFKCVISLSYYNNISGERNGYDDFIIVVVVVILSLHLIVITSKYQ